MPQPPKYDKLEVLDLLEKANGICETTHSILNKLKEKNPRKYEKIQWSGVNRMLKLLVREGKIERIVGGGMKNNIYFYRIKPKDEGIKL